MRKFLVQCALHAYIISLYVALPLMPLLASVVFLRSKYLLQYPTTLRRLLVLPEVGLGDLGVEFRQLAGQARVVKAPSGAPRRGR